MALTATTLSVAITAGQTSFAVASASGIAAPNYTSTPAGQTGANISYLLIEQELIQVQGLSGTTVSALRGYGGTQASAHAAACPVLGGTLPSDFGGFVPAQGATAPLLPFGSVAFSSPLTGATITPLGPYFHFTGTVALVTINLPNYLNEAGSYPGYYPDNPIAGMQINIVFDGSSTGLTWTNAGNIGVAGTSGTAGTMVTFTYDPSISKWIPSRIL